MPLSASAAPADGASDNDRCRPAHNLFRYWLGEGITDYSTYLEPLGALRAIILFVDYPDAPESGVPSAELTALGEQSEQTLTELSGGAVTVDIAGTSKWYRMPADSSTYGFDRNSFTHEKFKSFMRTAVGLADPDVDFSMYDMVFVASAEGAETDSVAFIDPPPEQAIVADGVPIRHGLSVGGRAGMTTFIDGFGSPHLLHELVHIFGIPDLYTNVAPHHQYAGAWDIMGQVEPLGNGLLGWHKWKMGWLDEEVTCLDKTGDITITLAPMEGAGTSKLLAVRTGASTAYAVEYRTKVGHNSRACTEGVLVYEVDTSVASGQGPLRIKPARPDGADLQTCGYLYNAPLRAGDVVEDTADGVRVEVISMDAAGATVKVTYSGTYELPAEAGPEDLDYGRSVSLSLRRHLKAKGAVTVEGGYANCGVGVTVKVMRVKDGALVQVASTKTDGLMNYVVRLPDKKGKYRAVVDEAPLSGDGSCSAASSALVRHVH